MKWFLPENRRNAKLAVGFLASIAGVVGVTWLISIVLPRYHVANISMIYLLLILALAVWAGSGPAILASLLAFLAFDWFFVTPVGRFTVEDPSEWLALFLFLVVAIISGQLAAGLRSRAAEARRRARETATLYELSMEILADARLEHVLRAIADRMLQTLGLRSVAVFLVEADGGLRLATEAGGDLDEPEREERELNARWALRTGATNRFATNGSARITRPLDRTIQDPFTEQSRLIASYIPVVLGGQTLGLVAAIYPTPYSSPSTESRNLLDAFVAQTALAIGRAKLAAEEEKARAAAESERMKSTFLASVSHDLRTPLTAIKAAAEGLREEAESRGDAPHSELAAGIDREVGRLDRLVGNLLEISRIEAGGLPLNKVPEDLSEIVGIAVSRLTPMLAGRTLTVYIPDSLPLVPVEAVQIDRVLTNLLENAIKFSPEGSEIVLRATIEGDSVVIRVRNAGRPLGAEERRRIFDKFYRLDAGDRGPRGVGLGLAICKGIVEAHDGQIWEENDDGGVTFLIRLPLSSSPERILAGSVSE
jgi:two-component system sensor histidine kinase KdpD